MLTEIDGFDRTDSIPHDSLSLSGSINDPMSSCEFELIDPGSQLALAIGMEVLIHDENTPPLSISPLIPSPPSRNILQHATNFVDTNAWLITGTLSSLVASGNPAIFQTTMTFNNSPLGSGFIQQSTLLGYAKAGQRYTLSVYTLIATPLSNAQAVIRMEFLSQDQIVLATISDVRTSTLNNSQQRLSLQGLAPANTTSIRVSFGGQTTIGGNNSGSVRYGTPQLEPMTFISRGLNYPTPDCNFDQVNCSSLPDDTISRTTRIFAGYIEQLQITYDGPNRIYRVGCAPAEMVLDNTNLISKTYTNLFDDEIIEDILALRYNGLLSGNADPSHRTAPNSVLRGVRIPTASYTDLSFREVLNNLADQSGFTYFVSAYYQLCYQPAFYNVALISFSDTPDQISSMSYYDYQIEIDGTQLKQRIKVVGANPEGPEITDTFGGSGTLYFLSRIPKNISGIFVNGTKQNAGIIGINTFAQGYQVLVDPANKTMTFNTTTPSGATVEASYTYQNPVVVTLEKLDGISSTINAPNYVTPAFDAKVNDSALTSLASANIRGLAEITKMGNPRTILTFKANHYIPPGDVVYFTSSKDAIINQPFVIQQVESSYLGAGVNEHAYTLGSYNPNIIDQIRNTNKAINRSTDIGDVTISQQTDIATTETISWSEAVSIRP